MTDVSKRTVWAVLVVSLTHAAPVTPQHAENASTGPTPTPTATEPANRIPLELHRNLAPVLVANIDGAQVRLQVDLGNGNALMLRQSVLDSINAVRTGESANFQGLDGVFESPMFKVARVQIGTAVFTDVVAWLDAPRQGYEPGEIAQGFMGTGLLKTYQLVLDYPGRAMTLVGASSEDSIGPCKGAVMPFSAPSDKLRGEPVTEAEIDLGRVRLWWDTGAPVSVLSRTFAQKAQSKGGADILHTKELVLGGHDFGPWRFEVWDVSLPGFDGFIGHDFFAQHVVCIDSPGIALR